MSEDVLEYNLAIFRRRLALAGDLSWLLWEQQIPIYNAIRALAVDVDEFVVLCARQFGKSHLGVLLAVEDAIRHRDRCIVVVGPDTKQTKDIVNPRMRRIQQNLPDGLLVQSKAENKWIVYHTLDKRQLDFTEIVIGGMNENSSSQRGKTVQTIYIEESGLAAPDDYLESLRSDLGPSLTHSDFGKIIHLTTPPKVPDHPFITDTLSAARLNNALAVFTIDDNRALSEAQYEACIRRSGGRDTDDFRREYLCQIIRDSSIVVIPSFNEHKHVKRVNVPAFTNWHIMIDWGGVRDYTVGLLYTYDYLRNKILIAAEFLYYENTPTSIIWARALQWQQERQIPVERVWADAPGQTLVDLSAMYNTSIAMPGKDDWEAEINNLNVMFGIDKIEVDLSCKFLIETLRSGVFNKKRTDFERTKALGHCDAIAALKYAVRHVVKDNPYPETHAPSDHYFIRKPADEDAEMAGAVGRGFGRYRAK